MSNLTGTIRAKATVESSASPTIYNVATILADTEVSQATNIGVKQLLIRVRGFANLKIAFVSGESGVKFITVPRGCSLTLEGLLFTGTLYLQTDKPGQVVEILEWV